MFSPEEVIFAPTARCNLACAHCRVTRVGEELDLAASLEFLGDCVDGGIDRIGFSGGEPFLKAEFLAELAKAAVEQGMLFDRLMTNAVWWRDEAELRKALVAVENAGFDGVYGVSVDSWHPQDAAKLVAFIGTAFELRARRDCVEVLSVRHPDEGPCRDKLAAVAAAFGGELHSLRGEPESISDRIYRERPDTGEDVPEALFIDIHRFDYSAAASPDPAGDGAWGATEWFEDDHCAGPGNVLYVHPTGDVAVCCGYGNENPGLIIGNIARDDLDTMLENAERSLQVRTCYDKGLGVFREELEAAGRVLPGKTRDQCFFCDWCARQGLFGK